jgi:5'-deoxynucleotidase YfbR-like HD superfamily hydrolase
MSGEEHDITGFLYEIGLLKRYPRTGWALAGVPAAESVAEHSFRAATIAAVIAVTRATRTCSPGSTPHWPACAPRRRNSSPARRSPRTPSNG